MPEVYEQADKFAAALRARDARASSAIVDAYGASWARIRDELARHTERSWAALREAGMADAPLEARRAWMIQNHPAWVYQRDRYRATLLELEAAIGDAADAATLATVAAQRDAINMAAYHAGQAIGTGLEATAAGLVANYTLPNMAALEAMVGFTAAGTPLGRLLAEYGGPTGERIAQLLADGIAGGLNPREVAARARDLFGGDLTRALRVARTETMRAYREAAHSSYEANADVLEGWTWVSALGPRTCAACWAKHGTVYPISERMAEHVMGRCAMVPLTKTWAALGLEGVPETRLELAAGADEFARLTPMEQRRILGPKRYELYQEGELTLEDMATTVDDPVWGPSTRVANLRTAHTQADARRALEAAEARRLELERDGITPEAWERAGADLEELKRRIREEAAHTAGELEDELGPLSHIGRPPRRVRHVDPRTGRVTYRAPTDAAGAETVGGEWDWFYELPEVDQKRIRRHMEDDGAWPDQVQVTLRDMGAHFEDSTEGAMDWWQDRARRWDGARALARGKPPGYVSAGDLAPRMADELPGLDLADLFTHEGRLRLAQHYTDEAGDYARRVLSRDRWVGTPPWNLTPTEYVDELADLEARAAGMQPLEVDDWWGPKFSEADQRILDRLGELIPDGLDDGTMDALELHRRIGDTARLGGLTDTPPARVGPEERRRLRTDAAARLRATFDTRTRRRPR